MVRGSEKQMETADWVENRRGFIRPRRGNSGSGGAKAGVSGPVVLEVKESKEVEV